MSTPNQNRQLAAQHLVPGVTVLICGLVIVVIGILAIVNEPTRFDLIVVVTMSVVVIE